MIVRHSLAVTSSVARAVLAGALPALPEESAGRAADRVAAQVDRMPDVTLVGVRMAERACVSLLSVAAGRSFTAAPADRRAAALSRVEGLGLPLVGDYLRLVRSLALVAAHGEPG